MKMNFLNSSYLFNNADAYIDRVAQRFIIDFKYKGYEVDGVKQGKPSNDEKIGDVWVDLMAAVVFLCIVCPHRVDDGPFAALPVVVQVHVFSSFQVDLGLVVRPGAKFHFTVLLIKGEEGDVDAAGALVNGRRDPADFTVVE